MLFANKAVISSHEGALTLMVRFANERHNVISNATAKLWMLKNVVTAEGQVRTCKVVKGLPFMNTAVIGALERRKYKPAAAHGKPVDVYYTFNIRLKLPSR